MIDRVLADQAVEKLLSTGDARLRRCGGRIFKTLKEVTAIEEQRDRIRKAISRLESDFEEVRTEFLESVIAKMNGLLAQAESRYHQLLLEINEVVLDVLGLQIDVPSDFVAE